MDEQPGLIDSLRRYWLVLAIFVVIGATAAVVMMRKAPSTPDAEAVSPPVEAAAPPSKGEAGGEPAVADKSGENKSAEDKAAAPPAAQSENPAASVMSQTVAVEARPAIVLRGEGKWDEAEKLIPEALAKLKAAAAKAGLPVNGRPVTVFTKTDDSGFSFEAMLPLAAAPEGKAKLADGVEVGASPSGKALKFQHRGSYDEIEATYEAIAAYLDEKGLDTKDLIVEEYLSDFKGDDASVDVDIYVFLK
jgi:effector-binding domain-containing protein